MEWPPTDSIIPGKEAFAALEAIHRDIAAGESPWADEVEAYYLTRTELRRDDPSFGWHLKVNRGNQGILEPLQPDAGWLIQNYLLREYGVALVGPDPRTLVEPVAPGDLRRAMSASAPEWLEEKLPDSASSRHWGSRTYLVLTLCRVLHTLANDAVASKKVAGRWPQSMLGDEWRPLFERALAWRKDLSEPPDQATAERDTAATRDLIRYVLARCAES